MILIIPDLIPKILCEELIRIHNINQDLITEYHDTRVLDMNLLFGGEDDTHKTVRKCSMYLERTVSKHFTAKFVEYVQIVKWLPGASMNLHTDNARETTSLVSITNLNDDFQGGAHYIDDLSKNEKLDILPKVGKTVVFEGKKYEHGVRKVTSGTRYTLAIWYTNDLEGAVDYESSNYN
nr:hypothetical protein [uncultured Mediterranean phage uvMED]|tara:strand:+ start:12962 stop:13498 length:537 start_codon:yes stop_codon:yes gene_type:complete